MDKLEQTRIWKPIDQERALSAALDDHPSTEPLPLIAPHVNDATVPSELLIEEPHPYHELTVHEGCGKDSLITLSDEITLSEDEPQRDRRWLITPLGLLGALIVGGLSLGEFLRQLLITYARQP
jgi:hypothetical protein